MRKLVFLLVLLPALVLAQENVDPQVSAPKKATKDQVYKWVDKDGVVHYSNKPPTDDAKPAKLPPLQTYKGGTTPNLSKYDKPTSGKPAAGGSAQIDVVTPTREETFRGGERTVPVGVVVTPALAEGQRLIYLLDGTPQASPTPDTSFALTNVERGSHTVSVTLIDASGNQLGSSAPVTFHVKPPTARVKAP
jgi:hypothetical protein